MENPVISREYVEKEFHKKDKVIQELCEQLELRSPLTAEEWKRVAYDKYYDELLEETKDENNITPYDSFKKEQSTDTNK